MEVKKILVPYNFTGNDQKALDFVIQRYGQDANVEITLFHAYTAVPKIDVSDKTTMTLMNSNLSYLRQKITELEIEFDKGFFTMSTSKKIMKSLPGIGIHMVV